MKKPFIRPSLRKRYVLFYFKHDGTYEIWQRYKQGQYRRIHTSNPRWWHNNSIYQKLETLYHWRLEPVIKQFGTMEALQEKCLGMLL